jgi:hypothetical protein
VAPPPSFAQAVVVGLRNGIAKGHSFGSALRRLAPSLPSTRAASHFRLQRAPSSVRRRPLPLSGLRANSRAESIVTALYSDPASPESPRSVSRPRAPVSRVRSWADDGAARGLAAIGAVVGSLDVASGWGWNAVEVTLGFAACRNSGHDHGATRQDNGRPARDTHLPSLRRPPRSCIPETPLQGLVPPLDL